MRTLIAGVFWIPVFVVLVKFDLPWWTPGIFYLPFTVGMQLIEHGTRAGWFDATPKPVVEEERSTQ